MDADEPDFHRAPGALLDALVAARNRGDVVGALGCYEPTAAVVLASGHVVSGHRAVLAMLADFVALQPTFEVNARTIVESDGVALHLSRWTLHGTDATGDTFIAQGCSSDVVRRQPDGGWLLAVDDPWGADLLTATATSEASPDAVEVPSASPPGPGRSGNGSS